MFLLILLFSSFNYLDIICAILFIQESFITRKKRERARALLEKGYSRGAVAHYFGVSVRTISYWAPAVANRGRRPKLAPRAVGRYGMPASKTYAARHLLLRTFWEDCAEKRCGLAPEEALSLVLNEARNSKKFKSWALRLSLPMTARLLRRWEIPPSSEYRPRGWTWKDLRRAKDAITRAAADSSVGMYRKEGAKIMATATQRHISEYQAARLMDQWRIARRPPGGRPRRPNSTRQKRAKYARQSRDTQSE